MEAPLPVEETLPSEQVPDWLAEIEAEAEAVEPLLPEQPAPELPEAVEIMAEPESEPILDWLSETAEPLPGAVEEDRTIDEILGDTQPIRPKPAPLPEEVSLPEESIEAALEAEEVSLPEEPVEAAPVVIEAELLPQEELVEPVMELPEEPAAVEAQPAAPAEEMSVDAAMAWLEALAAKQGVPEEELTTRPEERVAETPEWVQALAAEDSVAPAEPKMEDWLAEVEAEAEAVGPEAVEPAAEAAAPADELPDWLSEITPLEPVAPPAAEPQQKVEPMPEWLSKVESEAEAVESAAAIEKMPDIDMGDADAAMAWLESLAAKQGVPEEELTSKPEERPETPPEWVQEIEAVETPAEAPQVEAPVAEPPVVEPLPAEQVTAVEPAPVEPAPSEEPAWFEKSGTTEPTEIELPSWLSEPTSAQPLDEEYAWTPPTTTPETEDATPKPPRRGTGRLAPETAQLDINKASLVEMEALPGVGFILAQNIIGFRDTFGAFTRLEDLLKVPGISAAVLDELRPMLKLTTPSKEEAVQPAPVGPQLQDAASAAGDQVQRIEAHNAVLKGEISQAAASYLSLIKRELLLDEVVDDLRELVQARPGEFLLWQTLGDAYVRDNRLQDALQAYIKAEELLR
jgi:competence ComEA-like helix-hairpin-helix protein